MDKARLIGTDMFSQMGQKAMTSCDGSPDSISSMRRSTSPAFAPDQPPRRFSRDHRKIGLGVAGDEASISYRCGTWSQATRWRSFQGRNSAGSSVSPPVFAGLVAPLPARNRRRARWQFRMLLRRDPRGAELSPSSGRNFWAQISPAHRRPRRSPAGVMRHDFMPGSWAPVYRARLCGRIRRGPCWRAGWWCTVMPGSPDHAFPGAASPCFYLSRWCWSAC